MRRTSGNSLRPVPSARNKSEDVGISVLKAAGADMLLARSPRPPPSPAGAILMV